MAKVISLVVAWLALLPAWSEAQDGGTVELYRLLRAPTLRERVAGAGLLAGADEATWREVMRSLVSAGQALEARILELIERLGDERWMAREEAQRELVRMGLPAVSALAEAAREDPLLERRWRAAEALAEISKASPDLARRWEREDDQRRASAWALGVSPPTDPARREEAGRALLAATHARDSELARLSLIALSRLGDSRAAPGLMRLAASSDPYHALQGLGGLERLGDAAALVEIASGANGSLLALAAWAAGLRLEGRPPSFHGPEELAPFLADFRPGPTEAHPASWRVLLGSGEGIKGKLFGLTPEELLLELPEGILLPLPMNDLARAELLVGREGPEVKPDGPGEQGTQADDPGEPVLDWVLLVSGSWLPGRVLEKNDQVVRLDLEAFGERTLPRWALAATGKSARPGPGAGLGGAEGAGPGREDPLQPFLVPTLQFLAGGELKGFLIQGGPQGVLLLEPRLGFLLIPLDRISSVTFRTGLGIGFNLTLIADYEANEVFKVDDLGRRVWGLADLDGPWDARWLPTGNILVCEQGSGVREYTPEGKIVWEFTDTSIPYSAQRLPSGNTLIADTGNRRVIEVSAGGKIVWEYGPIEAFDAKRLPSGNTLVAEPARNRVREISPAGETLWEADKLPGALDADRLPNGNTLVTCRDSHSVIEIDARGAIVWRLTGLQTPNAAKRLPGGLTLVAESGQVRLFDLAGRVVWRVAAGWAGEAHRY